MLLAFEEAYEFDDTLEIQASLLKKFEVNESYDKDTLDRISRIVREKVTTSEHRRTNMSCIQKKICKEASFTGRKLLKSYC